MKCQACRGTGEIQGYGDRVRAARRAMGWTQCELGIEVGVSPEMIGKIERGERGPGPALQTELAATLKIDCTA